jgi:hypothetical protein
VIRTRQEAAGLDLEVDVAFFVFGVLGAVDQALPALGQHPLGELASGELLAHPLAAIARDGVSGVHGKDFVKLCGCLVELAGGLEAAGGDDACAGVGGIASDRLLGEREGRRVEVSALCSLREIDLIVRHSGDDQRRRSCTGRYRCATWTEDLCDIASDREHLRTLFEAIRHQFDDRDARIPS